MNHSRHNIVGACLLSAATLMSFQTRDLSAQTASLTSSSLSIKSGVAARITSKIDESRRATLAGHVRPFLKKATDHGAVADSMQTGPIMLMFSRTTKQQADLDALVDQLHNKNSAQYHQWLTPAQFGAKFSPADSDVAAVKTWLQSKGFTVLDVVPSKTYISFTGTVGQLKSAFGVSIHKMTIHGEEHVATINDPQIPAALQPVVGGLHNLDDFGGKPLYKPAGAFTRNETTGKWSAKAGTTPITAFTTSNSDGTLYQVGPQDFYTIYNENPLLQAGITGAGQTIAVIEQTQVVGADVTTFRSLFGLPAYPATPNATAGGVNYLYGTSTGLNGYASCYAPYTTAKGKNTGDEGEAALDLQWAGSVAPNAIVDFVGCGGTKTNPGGTVLGALGIDHSAQYIANYLYATVGAASMSYGECEADMTASTSTGVGYYNNQWEQFAAEGITPIISSGDGGAEQCYQNDANATTLPPSVNGFGSSAYNVSAGGTDFGDLYESAGYTTTPVTAWWNATNGTGQSSAVAYNPETTWAGYCSSQLFDSYLQFNNSTLLGTDYTPSGVCSNATSISDGYTAVVGGAGGISTFNTIPTWQSVYGVGLNSVSSTYRNLPDVSLYASNGFWGHLLPYCESDLQACTLASYSSTTDDLGAGGTSFVAPQLAGFMALVNQKTGQHQGQANYTFYNLANLEYGTTSTAASSLAACSGSALTGGATPPSSCFFHDVSNDMPSLQGGTITPGIYQPCLVGDIDCYQGTGVKYGVNTVPGTTASAGILGYTASPGYDDATGLGSMNINSIVNGWNTATPQFPSTTTLSSSSNSISSTGSVTLTANVVATGRGGAVAPAGTVTFYVNSTSGTNLGTGSIASSCTGTGASTSCLGVASLAVPASSLPAGSDNIIAYFGGDGANDAPSTSSPVTVAVTGNPPIGNLEQAIDQTTGSTTVSTSDKIFVSGWVADPTDGSPLSNVKVYIDTNLVGVPTLGGSRPDVVAAYNNPAYANSGYTFSYSAAGITAGSHVVTIVATDNAGLTTSFGPLTINVTVPAKAPVGNLDQVVDSVTGTQPVSSTGTLFASGWAADYQDNGPAKQVQIFIDGSAVGNATLGASRPDVASAYSKSSWSTSGWTFTYPGSSLAIGNHTLSAVAVDSLGLTTSLGPITFSVQ
jgi:hypothetical protein